MMQLPEEISSTRSVLVRAHPISTASAKIFAPCQDSAIRRVVIYMPLLGPNANGDYSIPAAGRLRMRQATFQKAPCPPLVPPDDKLDEKSVVDSMKAMLQRSNPNGVPGTRLERGGVVWELPDGSHLVTELAPPFVFQSECEFAPNFGPPQGAPPPPVA